MTYTLDDIAKLKKLRRVVWLQASSMLLWLPCAVLSAVFFMNDTFYQAIVRDPVFNTSLVERERALAHELDGIEGFACDHPAAPAFDDPDERDLLLRVMERSGRLSASRRDMVGTTLYIWFEQLRPLDLALLRRGTAVAHEYARAGGEASDFEDRVIDHYCDDQTQRRRFNQPPLAPIPAYAPARALLRDAAARMEVVLAQYAEVRPWLLAFFYLWIAYSLAGLAAAIYLIKLNRRLRASADLERQLP